MIRGLFSFISVFESSLKLSPDALALTIYFGIYGFNHCTQLNKEQTFTQNKNDRIAKCALTCNHPIEQIKTVIPGEKYLEFRGQFSSLLPYKDSVIKLHWNSFTNYILSASSL